jgi:hypothetical protein
MGSGFLSSSRGGCGGRGARENSSVDQDGRVVELGHTLDDLEFARLSFLEVDDVHAGQGDRGAIVFPVEDESVADVEGVDDGERL